MSAPGLAPTVKGEKRYRLGPFLVGWYESNMRLLDKEFAGLFEQFVIEGGGERIFAPRPGVLGVVPVRGSLKPEYIEREPHVDIDAHSSGTSDSSSSRASASGRWRSCTGRAAASR